MTSERNIKLIIKVGFIVFILSIAIVFNVDHLEKFAFYGTWIAGIVGTLWALAGILLFYNTLTLQKEELKLQREELSNTRKVLQEQGNTLKLQQSEATFFKLLENHRDLVRALNHGKSTGYKYLDEIYYQLQSRIRDYKAAVKNKEFKLGIIDFDPIKTLKNDTKTLEILTQVSCDLIHIITFIDKQLTDKEFYHATLYSNLASSEKYLFGMLIILDFLSPITEETIWHDYIQYYLSSEEKYYNPKEGKLPDLEFELNKPEIKINSSDEVQIIIINNDSNKVYFQKIELYYKPKNQTHSISINSTINPQEKYRFEVRELYQKLFLEDCTKQIKHGNGNKIDRFYTIICKLYLKYNDTSFQLNFNIKNEVSNQDDISRALLEIQLQ